MSRAAPHAIMCGNGIRDGAIDQCQHKGTYIAGSGVEGPVRTTVIERGQALYRIGRHVAELCVACW